MARLSNNLRSNKKLAFENMEDRQMMAGDIAFNAQTGVMTITGDNQQDFAQVDFRGTHAYVSLQSQRPDGGFDNHSLAQRISNITRIEFDGNNDFNRMDITQSAALSKGVNLNGLSVLFQGGIDRDLFHNNTSVRSTAYGYYGDDEFHGGSGVDTFHGEVGVDYLYGNAGADHIEGGESNDFLYGGDGPDTIFGGNGVNRLYGDAGNDTLIGGEEADFIWGGLGNDTMEGRGGHDSLNGENGNDNLYGGDGDDILTGSNGFDRLFGGNDNDILNGGYDSSIDYLEGGGGSDTFQSVYRRLMAANWVIMHQDTVADLQQGDTLVHQIV